LGFFSREETRIAYFYSPSGEIIADSPSWSMSQLDAKFMRITAV
jgi:hypothetical protein